jgi:hypothetical protein
MDRVGDGGWLLAYDGGMGYGQRGGYTPAGQQRRERLRLEAAGLFAAGDSVSVIARDLRADTPSSSMTSSSASTSWWPIRASQIVVEPLTNRSKDQRGIAVSRG